MSVPMLALKGLRKTFSPGTRARPFRKVSSMRNARPCTVAPRLRTRSTVAFAVPPVASTSSTMKHVVRCVGDSPP
jgi:hypothetical protein